MIRPDKIVSITNRHFFKNMDNFYSQIKYLCSLGIYAVILREKDMSRDEYRRLSEKVIDITSGYKTRIILHTHVDVAEEINYKYIHLPMKKFKESSKKLKAFNLVGVSTHTVEEAVEAQSLGASYITASHIYKTQCKAGAEPKGTGYLTRVCKSVDIPVYALGGINFENMEESLNSGADKVCMMSELMKLK
ncbi:MAG: thiamine phosphate synthase [Lachnospiraceae bacterium]